jgi:glycosyltransferase involved in cell wall biosynthesis
MKILFVSALLPYPLYSGGQVRLYNLLSRVAEHHEISLFTYLRTSDEKKYVKNLPFCKNVETVMRGRARQLKYIFSAIATRRSLLFASYDNAYLRQKIASAVFEADKSNAPYDLIHIEPGYVGMALPAVRIPLVVAEHNIEYEVYRQYARHSPWRFFLDWDVENLRKSEVSMWQKADRIVTVYEGDKTTIENTVKGKAVKIVRNGVDTQTFTYKPKKIPKDFTCLYVGNFSWIQNIHAVSYLLDSIWPVIHREFPTSKLRLVGASMPESLTYKVGALDGVTATGTVRSIANEYHSAHVLLAPLKVGGGTKYKILEALSCGTPVITSDVGAQGISNDILYLAKTPVDYVTHIKTMQNGNELGKKLNAARKLIEKEYTWDAIAASLEDVWKKTHEASR